MKTETKRVPYGEHAEYLQNIKGWICNKCNRYWGKDERMASVCCCTTRVCEKCGSDTGDKYRTLCSTCIDLNRHAKIQEKLDKAELVEWDGGMIVSDEIGFNDGYFDSPDALIEYCEDEGIDVPEFAHCCKARSMKIDASEIIEDALAGIEWDLTEFGDPSINGEDELAIAIERFNELNKDIKTYWPDYSRKVRLR